MLPSKPSPPSDPGQLQPAAAWSTTAAAVADPAAAPARPAGDDQLAALRALAESLEGDPGALLDLLRRLEQLHRSIQDGPFRSSLPADRNCLFQLLEAMEGSGGWPYIPRLQLRTFMDLLELQNPTP
jgi:hypothetical protein